MRVHGTIFRSGAYNINKRAEVSHEKRHAKQTPRKPQHFQRSNGGFFLCRSGRGITALYGKHLEERIYENNMRQSPAVFKGDT